MKIIVLKFGGTSVGSIERIKKAVSIIQRYIKKKYKVIVVSSAMKGVTNELVKKSKEISGNFSDSALLCSLMEMGSDKILFAVDWPYNNNKDATSWIKRTKLSPDDYQKITHLNAQKLLNLNF